MTTFIPGLIMGFREGLEAFLVLSVILRFLGKSGLGSLKKNVFFGAATGIALSLVLGGLLYNLSAAIDRTDEWAKLWESGASLVALALVTTFIVWMIRNGRDMVGHVHQQVSANLTPTGVFLVASVMVLREGAEVAIFTFAGKYVLLSILAGLALALVLTLLISYALVKIDLKTLFTLTLGYLILQAGFLLGYGIHEGLSALKDLQLLDAGSWLYAKAFNLSETVFNHKSGALGLPLYVLFGWYSKPEWIQFIAQYGYTAGLLLYWKKQAQ